MSTRRLLLRAAVIATGGPPADPTAADPTTADLGTSAPSAMCVDGATISWIGPDREADRFVDGADEVLHLEGQLITPAFVDSHVHLSQTGHQVHGIDLSVARNADEVLAAVDRYARTNPAGVILGSGWDETRWADRRLPTAAELDRAAPERAVCLSRVDGHSAIVSGAVVSATPGLAHQAGWSSSGRVERAAQHHVREQVQEMITPSQQEAALRAALNAAAAAGIGCVHEMSAPHINPAEDIEVLRRIAMETPPTVRVVPYWGELDNGDGRGGVARARELGCVGAGGDLCVDGALGSRTAALRADYHDAPGHRGHRYLDPEQIRAHVAARTRAGLQAGFHCIGDDAMDAVIAGCTAAANDLGWADLARMRHRLEHAELVAPELITTLARLGLVVSAQPAFDAAWGGSDAMYADRLGRDRAVLANPFAAYARAQVPLAFGSDSPVTPFDPWGGVRAAVHPAAGGRGLDVAHAFAAHTVGGWAAVTTTTNRAGAAERGANGTVDNGNGVLRVGSAATFAVWERANTSERATHTSEPAGCGSPLPALGTDDPLPECVRTVVAGRTIFARA